MKIIKVFDGGGQTIDRYVVITNWRVGEHNMGLSLSKDPDWPLGFSQWGMFGDDFNDGDEIQFSDLPENVQKHVLRRIEEDD